MNSTSIPRLFQLGIVLFSTLLNSPSWATECMTEASAFIAAFNKIDPQQGDPEVDQTFKVFERVQAVADNNKKGLFTLTVLNTEKLIAVALPGNNVVLSKGTITKLYQAADQPSGIEASEARLAFVLGHELGHLVRDDFIDVQIYQIVNGNGDSCPPADSEAQQLAADKKGFVYAGMAGYQVDLLLPPENGQTDDFLTYWVKQATPKLLGTPELSGRINNLRKVLQTLQTQIPLFEFGMRLAHFERCDDGKYFLEKFQQEFPAREVLNNLGFCHLQQARLLMDIRQANFYWMPLVLEVETQVSALVRGTEAYKMLKLMPLSREVKIALTQASYYLKQAVESDVNYWPARVNLAVAYLYLGKANLARNFLFEAEAIAPTNVEIKALQAVALYEQSEPTLDLWEKAVEKLKELASQSPTTFSIDYNLARLYELRLRPAEAKTYWDKLLLVLAQLPNQIRTLVCDKTTSTCPVLPISNYPSKSMVPWPIEFVWQPLSTQESIMSVLETYEQLEFKLSRQATSQGSIYYTPPRDRQVLEIGDYLNVQVVKGDWALNEFTNECRSPLRQRLIASGTLWSCNKWAVLEKGGRVKEVWGVLKLDK